MTFNPQAMLLGQGDNQQVEGELLEILVHKFNI